MADIQESDSLETTADTGEKTQKEDQTVEVQKTEQGTAKDVEKDYEPEVRQNPWSNRDERNKFFAEKNKGKKDEEEGQKNEEGEQPDPRYMTKEDFKQFFSPLQETFNEQSIKTGIASFLSNPDNSEFKQYEAKALKYLKVHTTVPISDAFKTLAFDDAQALGAQKGEKSKEMNNRRKVGGTSSRPSNTAPDFKGMSDKEFDEIKDKIAVGEKISVE